MRHTALLLPLLLAVACSGGDDDDGGPTPDAPTSGADGATGADSAGPGGDAAPGTDAAAHTTDPVLGLSAGCGVDSPTGLQERTIAIDGVDRTFLRSIPDGYDPTVPVALVVVLHGSGGTAARARGMIDDMETRAGNGAIFVYPQALPNAEGVNRWEPSSADSADVHFMDDLVRRAAQNYCVDLDRVFFTGFSLGARFTSLLGCWRGDKIRAIAPVAPGGTTATLPLDACVGEVGIWEGLGTRDTDHTEGATLVRDHYAAANGCATTRTVTTPEGCEAYDGCRAETPSVWCTYDLAHEWPPIGAEGVWNFFSSFPTLTPVR